MENTHYIIEHPAIVAFMHNDRSSSLFAGESDEAYQYIFSPK